MSYEIGKKVCFIDGEKGPFVGKILRKCEQDRSFDLTVSVKENQDAVHRRDYFLYSIPRVWLHDCFGSENCPLSARRLLFLRVGSCKITNWERFVGKKAK